MAAVERKGGYHRGSASASGYASAIDLTSTTKPTTAPSISTIDDLDTQLPQICSSIFRLLSSRQLEATYQRCLEIDLLEAGVDVASEVSVSIEYKGRVVGTRRADLVLKVKGSSNVPFVGDGSRGGPFDSRPDRAVVELKAVASLTGEHLRQLEFYMQALDIDVGYLVNFPHDAGFPDLEAADGCGRTFLQVVLSGDSAPLSDVQTRSKRAQEEVHVVKVVRTREERAAENPTKSGQERAAAEKSGQSIVFGRTMKGEACKNCLKQRRFCFQHADQDPHRGGK